MALSDTSLTDIGQGTGKTTNFWVRYENSLTDQANVINNANSLLAVVENEFTVTTGWFSTPSGKFGTGHRQEVRLDQADADLGGGNFSFPGASNSGYGNPISLDSQNLLSDTPLPGQRVGMVFIAEWVEVLMGIAGNWNAGDSSGEGLSHWCAITRFQQGHDNYYGSFVANWLDGTGNPNQGSILPNPKRSDWVNTTYTGSTVSDGTFVHGDGDPVSYGCALAFLYYLNVQLGFSINQIIPNYNARLASIYHALTGDNANPFSGFLGLLEHVYPAATESTSISGPNRNNPFPIARVSFGASKNTFGRDETQDILNTQGGYVANAFALFVEGFSKASFQSLGVTVAGFGGTFSALSGVTIKPSPLGVKYESGVNDATPQRIEIPYDLQLSTPLLAQFPGSGETVFDLSVALESAGSQISGSQAAMQFELIAGADPYFANLNADQTNLPYLSQDLRVFTVTPGLNPAPIPGVAPMTDSTAGAYAYIQSLLTHLNAQPNGFANPAGPDPFTTIFPGQGDANQGDSSVNSVSVQVTGAPFPQIHVFKNYSFAVARVRLRGSAGAQASNVRVFFRLWTTQTNDTDYDPNGTYRSTPDSAGKPGSPLLGAGNTTIPFFATNNFSSQADYPAGPNVRTLTIPDHQDQLWAYYGCFLNLYDPADVINGAQVQTLLNGTHHCIVAQIAYDDAPIPQGVSPLSWDQLAQRNLQVTRSDNPGPAATHRIPQTFDTRPSKAVPPASGPNTIVPDELLIDWGNVPAGAVASLYWPQVQASDVLALASAYYVASPLGMSDTNTIRIPITRGVSYVPIPAGAGENFAGLITIDLPPSVHSGQVFDVTVKRLGTRIGKRSALPPKLQSAPGGILPDGRVSEAGPGRSNPQVNPPAFVERRLQWRYVVGTFQIRVPVATGEQFLPSELTTLAIMKWRRENMSPSNRWYPVLRRYIQYISGRVDGLGGDADAVPPSLTYVPPQKPPPHHAERELCGKVCEVLFDCHGEFTGFVLDDCCETHLFHCRTKGVGALVLNACHDGLTLCVWVEEERREHIRKLAVKA